MLKEPGITAFLPITRVKQAKDFYMNILGLNIISEDSYALQFEGNGTFLRLTIVPKLTPQPFTVLGFQIKEIESQVNFLTSKGIKFERYESLDQTDMGIWTSPSQAKIAWFKDPDGNLISLTEMPEIDIH